MPNAISIFEYRQKVEEIPGSVVTAACDQETHALLTNFHIIQNATQDSLRLRMTGLTSVP